MGTMILTDLCKRALGSGWEVLRTWQLFLLLPYNWYTVTSLPEEQDCINEMQRRSWRPQLNMLYEHKGLGLTWWFFPSRWLFDHAMCTFYAFCGVFFGLCSLTSLTVLSTVCCLKVCYPTYGKCRDMLPSPSLRALSSPQSFTFCQSLTNPLAIPCSKSFLLGNGFIKHFKDYNNYHKQCSWS